MRAIVKGEEPPPLAWHRKSGSGYADYEHKDELRRALVEEQRGICCYCMCAISADSGLVKIEHWRSQSRHSAEQLVYANLLAACPGGQGLPPHMQHCDTRKGNQVLKFNPADPRHAIETKIAYALADGRIMSADDEFDAQLNDVLGLNIPKIMRQRRAKIRAILEWHESYRRKHQRSAPRDVLERKRRKLTSESQSSLPAYSPVEVWWLDQRLAKMTR